MQNIKIFSVGAVGYAIIELLWRGYTHWTMMITGGICFSILYFVFGMLPHTNLILKCLIGAVVITLVEFSVGCIVNIYLGWNVWDYSAHSYHLLGQICPFYSVMWFLLCIPLNLIANLLRN